MTEKAERYLALLAVSIAALILFTAFAAFAHDHARPELDGWYSSQRNSVGQWCCNGDDQHAYEGDYTINKDGSVTVTDENGAPYTIEAYKVLTGPNPTGHPVWWYIEGMNGKNTFCFALGTGI